MKRIAIIKNGIVETVNSAPDTWPDENWILPTGYIAVEGPKVSTGDTYRNGKFYRVAKVSTRNGIVNMEIDIHNPPQKELPLDAIAQKISGEIFEKILQREISLQENITAITNGGADLTNLRIKMNEIKTRCETAAVEIAAMDPTDLIGVQTTLDRLRKR